MTKVIKHTHVKLQNIPMHNQPHGLGNILTLTQMPPSSDGKNEVLDGIDSV